MYSKAFVALIVISFIVFGFWLIRESKLYEKYAILWMFSSMVGAVIFFTPNLASIASRSLGFALPSNFLVFLGFATLLTWIFVLSSDVSKLRKQVESVSLELGITNANKPETNETSVRD